MYLLMQLIKFNFSNYIFYFEMFPINKLSVFSMEWLFSYYGGFDWWVWYNDKISLSYDSPFDSQIRFVFQFSHPP